MLIQDFKRLSKQTSKHICLARFGRVEMYLVACSRPALGPGLGALLGAEGEVATYALQDGLK